MMFIESWLGFSPDGGSGTWETALVIAAVVVVASVIRRYAHWSSASSEVKV
jgi:hypothetical protein